MFAASRRQVGRQVALLVGLLALILVALVIGLLIASHLIADTTAFLAAVADILAGGTLLFALLAAVVALSAYYATVRTPLLQVAVRFGHGIPPLTLDFDPPNEGGARRISQFIQTQCQVHLHNNSGVTSARNPAVKIQFRGMGAFTETELSGWQAGDHRHGIGWTSAQWDGGANYSIHPNWGRDLPILYITNLLLLPNERPEVWVEIVADGCSERIQLPVVFRDRESETMLSSA
jgi:hypothetical protein